MSERIRVPHGMTPPQRSGDLITSSVSFPVDDEGFFGRECPDTSCLGFFKLDATEYAAARASGSLTCPSCGQTAPEDSFWTKDQIRRAAAAGREFALGAADAIVRDVFKGLGTGTRRGSGMTVTFRPGRARVPEPLPTYVEQATVRTFTCPAGGHRAVLYDRLAACPYCGPDTPRRAILDDALAVQHRLLDALDHLPPEHRAEVLASGGAQAQAERCLTGAVAAVQSFAKDIHAATGKPVTVRNPWQSPDRLQEQWVASFGLDPFAGLSPEQVALVRLGFARRHILEHNGGVADERYLQESGDTVNVGRPVRYGPPFVRDFIEAILAAADGLQRAIV